MNKIFGIAAFLVVSPIWAASPPLRCQIRETGIKKIEYAIEMDVYGRFIAKGLVVGKRVDCDYAIQTFRYLPQAKHPRVEFELTLTGCRNAEAAGLIAQHPAITVFVQKGKYACESNLAFGFPIFKDAQPVFQGSEIRRYHEKFKKGVWP